MFSNGKSSYFQQVSVAGGTSVTQIVEANREFTKSGYVYIYVSNESKDFKVYFAVSRKTKYIGNNLKVTRVRGPLLSEEGYYPFGMTMSAISSSAGTVAKNNYKFNAGTELTESFDINYYETYFRQYDAQLGRFTGVDALAEKELSKTPYQLAINNPLLYNDPTGLLKALSDFNSVADLFSYLRDNNFNLNSISDFSSTTVNMWMITDLTGEQAGLNILEALFGGIMTGSNGKRYVTYTYTEKRNLNLHGDWIRHDESVSAYDPDKYEYGLVGEGDHIFVGRVLLSNFLATSFRLGQYGRLSNNLRGINISIDLADVVALNTIEVGFKGAARSASASGFSKAKSFINGARSVSKISRYGIGSAAIGLSAIEGLNNPQGWQKHNSFDVGLGLAFLTFPQIGLAYTIVDLGVQVFTDKSISEHVENWIEGN